MRLLVPKGCTEEPHHIKRLKSVAKWRLPPEDSTAWVDFRLQTAAAQRSPAFRKAIKDASRTASAMAVAVAHNGAGLPADTGLREFCDEYNRRVMRHGLHYLPSSFNIFESFLSYHAKYGVFTPIREVDHICSLRAFLDYEAGRPDPQLDDCARELPQNVAFNFSFTERPAEWTFGEAPDRFAISSASMVRHDNEITVMCLGGLECNLDAESALHSSFPEKGITDPAKPDLEIDPDLRAGPVPFGADGIMQRLYIAIRFDLTRRSIQVRYLLQDAGNMWHIRTDDPLTIDYAKELGDSDIGKDWTAFVDHRQAMFATVVRMLGLPNYFKSRAMQVVDDKAITAIAELGKTLKGKRSIKSAPANLLVYIKDVRTMYESGPFPSEIVLPVFELKVEREGFWERLEFGEYGTGQSGERVLGRTWVSKTLSRRQAVVPGVKISGASSSTGNTLLEGEEGYIYVLRNASHQIDVFKIGLTRRSVSTRASELSRGSGVPDKFLTVQSWWVPDVVYAEKRIHKILDDYRVNDSREFFRADYPVIRSAVELVMGELSGFPVSQ